MKHTNRMQTQESAIDNLSRVKLKQKPNSNIHAFYPVIKPLHYNIRKQKKALFSFIKKETHI